MVAARIATLSKGRPELLKNASIGAFSKDDASNLMNVGSKSVERAKKVLTEGTPELAQAVEQGKVAVSLAAKVTELEEEEQRPSPAPVGKTLLRVEG